MEIIEIKQEGWKSDLLRVDITIGNICNYKCWYCWPGSNEGNFKWPDFDKCTKNLSYLLDYYKEHTNKKKFEFSIMGGEVTHWKRFTDFIRYFKEKYDCTFTLTTNAAKKLDWWNESYHYLDYVAISVHHQYSDPEHIKQVADFLYSKNVYVVTMVFMDPFAWDSCMNIVKILKTSNYRWTIRYNEIIDTKIAYTDEHKKILRKEKARFANPFYFFKTNKIYKSRVKVIDNENKKHSFKDNELILKRLNSFKNWECDVGVDWIAVKADGQISGICGNGLYADGNIYNLYDINFIEEFKPRISSSICKKDWCWCSFETNMPKRKI